MTPITQAELSRKAGVTRSAIADAIKKKIIPVVEIDGKRKIDIENEEVKNYLKGNRQRQQAHSDEIPVKPEPKKRGRPKKQTTEQPKPKQKPPQKPKQLIVDQPRIEAGGGADSGQTVLSLLPEELQDLSKYDLDRLKTGQTFLKEQTKHDIERKKYIDRDLIRRAFGALYQIDSDEFLQLSHSLSARICQDVFGVNDPEKILKTSEVIDTDLYKVQNHIRVTFNRHLEGMEMEPIA